MQTPERGDTLKNLNTVHRQIEGKIYYRYKRYPCNEALKYNRDDIETAYGEKTIKQFEYEDLNELNNRLHIRHSKLYTSHALF